MNVIDSLNAQPLTREDLDKLRAELWGLALPTCPVSAFDPLLRRTIRGDIAEMVEECPTKPKPIGNV